MLIAKYRKPARNRLNQCVVCNKDFQRGLPAWLLAWSWQPRPNKRGPNSTAGRFAYGSKQTATRRNKYQRHDFSSTSTKDVHNKSATQIWFVSGECFIGFKDLFFAGSDSNSKSSGSVPPPSAHAASMVLYRSFACWLPGLPSTNSRPSTLNLKCPRLCNRGFGNVPCLRQPIRKTLRNLS